jgi:hypothetical protein
VSYVANVYEDALGRLPHRHQGAEQGTPCVACGVFCEALYVNAGYFHLNRHEFDAAEPLLRAAHWFAPWSPHAPANLARLLQARAEELLPQNPEGALELLREARDTYTEALQLRPGFEVYQRQLEVIQGLIAASNDLQVK